MKFEHSFVKKDVLDLQYFVDNLPSTVSMDTIIKLVEQSSVGLTISDSIRAWCEHDALHYLSGQPFTDKGEECVAFLEKKFQRGWFPLNKNYNTYFQVPCECTTITQELIDETADLIVELIYGYEISKMKFEYSFVKKGVFDLPETDWWGFDPEDSIEIQPHWKMEHLAVEMGLFPSTSQARKNGWSGEIPSGYTERKRIGKMKLSLFIHNPSDAFLADPEHGKDT